MTIAELEKIHDIKTLRDMANTTTNPELLEQLSQHRHGYIRLMVAGNTHTSSETLIKLAADEDKTVVEQVAQNETTPTKLLDQLASDSNIEIARLATFNPNVSEETLKQNSIKDNLTLRVHVAANKACPSEILTTLSYSKNEIVRDYVGRNLNTSEETLTYLSEDKDENVRASVGANPNVTRETLEHLAADDCTSVLEAVGTNINVDTDIAKKLAKHEERVLTRIITRNTKLPVLEYFAGLTPHVQCCVAEVNCEGLTPTLTKLGSSGNNHIRERVGDNSFTNSETLTYLYETWNEHETELLINIAKHHNTPDPILNQLVELDNMAVLRGLAYNKALNSELLTKLAGSEYASVREDVCYHSKVTETILKTLIKDSDEEVRAAANNTRCFYLNIFIDTLTGTQAQMAAVLAPTFTGFVNDLKNVLKTLNFVQTRPSLTH